MDLLWGVFLALSTLLSFTAAEMCLKAPMPARGGDGSPDAEPVLIPPTTYEEEANFTGACSRYQSKTCCSAAESDAISSFFHEATSGCGRPSDECLKFIGIPVCALKCDPYVHEFMASHVQNGRRLPFCASFCDRWFEACKGDPVGAAGTGTLNCLTHAEVYGDALGLCTNGAWEESDFTNNTNCFSVDFPDGSPNPNACLLKPNSAEPLNTADCETYQNWTIATAKDRETEDQRLGAGSHRSSNSSGTGLNRSSNGPSGADLHRSSNSAKLQVGFLQSLLVFATSQLLIQASSVLLFEHLTRILWL